MASSRVHVLLASWLVLLVVAPVLVEGENCNECYAQCKSDGSWQIFCFRCHACRIAEEWKRPIPPNAGGFPDFGASYRFVNPDSAEAPAPEKEATN